MERHDCQYRRAKDTGVATFDSKGNTTVVQVQEVATVLLGVPLVKGLRDCGVQSLPIKMVKGGLSCAVGICEAPCGRVLLGYQINDIGSVEA